MRTGRPKKERRVPEPAELVEALAARDTPQSEVAEMLGVSCDTIQRDPVLHGAWKKGRARMRGNLRGWQLRAARNGNSAILVWLGKTILGQREGNSESTPKIDIQARLRELDELDNDRLEAAK